MSEWVILGIVITFLAGFLIDFLIRFVRPFQEVRNQLDRAIALLDSTANALPAGGNVTDLRRIEEELSFDRNMQHLWREFRHTLHGEVSEDSFGPDGSPQVVRYRQTVPSEAYFSTRALVDVPLRTDFFRHLPGILTGLGIIGTFGGLVLGLSDFGVSGSANDVNASVAALVDTVKNAFLVSGSAIICSIGVTAIEKRSVTSLFERVQRLQQAIDKLFDSGAGEDYLAQIAAGSDKSATHLAHLKEGLINDLKHIFEEFAERQANTTTAAAGLISEGISSTLREPLTAMEQTLARSLDDQQKSVQALMEGSLQAFAERLEEVVGAKLTDAAAHIERAAGTLRDAIAQIDGSVQRIRTILDEVAQSAEPMAANAERMNVAADRLATTIEQSSETLDYAIGKLKSLAEQLSASMAAAQDIAEALEEGSTRAQEAAVAFVGTSTQLQSAQAQLSEVATSLQETAERNRREGETHETLTSAIETAASQLTEAQQEVDRFIEGLSGALTETHDAFSREINGTLNRTHEAFHQHLSTATEQLAGTVREFDEFLSSDFRDSVVNLRTEISRLAPNGSSAS